MKKTFLSLALVLSISLAFGAETKPVVSLSKTVSSVEKPKEILVEQPIVKSEKRLAKPVGTPECYALSCKVVCTQVYGPDLTMEQSMDNWELFEERYCG
ncbi:hypothetical protein [Emticicia sp.]|uniref:hypothetical protein n=1 Tax=Emticicia sp. TaxID=1930953 RepID=UPI0037521153